MITTILIFLASLAALIYGAKLITDSASHFARVMGVSEFIIGATIVALGTSLPELSSSIEAVKANLSEIVVGNVVGSNVANIALILGFTSIIHVVKTKHNLFRVDIPFLIISSLATLLFLVDLILTKNEAFVLLIAYTIFIIKSIQSHKKQDGHQQESLKKIYLLIFIFGLACLIYGAKYLISSAEIMMTQLGISEAIMGFVLIAVGTSLPELATSLMAAKKGHTDMMLGDIIGSNTFNSLVVLGIPALIAPVKTTSQFLHTAIPAMVLLTFIFSYMVYDKKITKNEGIILLILYFVTVYFVI